MENREYTDVKIGLCKRNEPCVTCTNDKCHKAGDIGADCPKWTCDRPYPATLECESCAFIKKYIQEMYGINI